MVFHQRGIAMESTDKIFRRKFSWRPSAVFSEDKQVEEPIQWMSYDLFSTCHIFLTGSCICIFLNIKGLIHKLHPLLQIELKE